MGKGQKGYRLTPMPNGKTLAWAWDPVMRSYRTKSFPVGQKEAARGWAMRQTAKYRLGRDRAPGALVDTVDAKDSYLVELGRRRRVVQHVSEAGRVLSAFARAVPDLAAPDAERLALEWWDGLPGSRERRVVGVVPKPLTAETCNRYLVFVQAMVKHAQEEDGGVLQRSPVGRIHKIGLDRRLKSQFQVDELRVLLNRADDYRRLFGLMVLAGLRIGEACGLQWGDVDWSGNVLAVRLREGVRIKRRKERLVPMMADLRDILLPDKGEGAAVVGGYSVQNGHRDFSRFMERAGMERAGRGPHSCRHTYAGLMTATGVPSLLLASYMGHDSMATTAGYARMATRYESVVKDWPKGDFKLLDMG